MGGIAGFLDISIPAHRRQTLAGMTKALQRRGHHANDGFFDGPVALGECKFTSCEIGSSTPVRQPASENRLAMVCCGEIFNHSSFGGDIGEINTLLMVDNRGFLSRHWMCQGEMAVAELDGFFALAVWDSLTKTLHLVRDRLGVKPLYYYQTARQILFGSEIKAILAHPDVMPVVDKVGMIQLVLPLHKTIGATPYKGIHEVPPGTIQSFQIVEGRVKKTERRYWQFLPGFRVSTYGNAVEELRELLLEIVNVHVMADVPVGCLLSGGLDSTIIAALAQRAIRKSTLKTYQVDFQAQDESGQWVEGSEDTPFARAAAHYLGTQHHRWLLDGDTLSQPSLRLEALQSRDLPNGIGDLDLSLLSLFHSVKSTSKIVLTGEAADEAMGGYRWFHEPAAIASGTFPWLADTPAHGRLHQRILKVFRQDLIDSLDLSGYLQADYAQALSELGVRSFTQMDNEEQLQFISYLALTRFLPTLLERKDRLSMSAGLKVRAPFCDHRLMEFAFSTPWHLKNHKGVEKALLKSMSVDLIPHEIISRSKAPYPSTHDRKYAMAVCKQLDRALRQKNCRLGEVFNLPVLEQVLQEPASGSFIANVATELALNFDTWFHLYEPSLYANG